MGLRTCVSGHDAVLERRLDPGAAAVVVAVWLGITLRRKYNNKPENVVSYRIPAEWDVIKMRRSDLVTRATKK